MGRTAALLEVLDSHLPNSDHDSIPLDFAPLSLAANQVHLQSLYRPRALLSSDSRLQLGAVPALVIFDESHGFHVKSELVGLRI
jgi:hypothetical protein